MADKKEVSILLLGIVAILAIVGLVLLFTSPAATGKAFFPPQLPPQMAYPASVGYGPAVEGGQASGTGYGNAILVSALEGSNLSPCPNGLIRTREQGNLDYEAVPGYLCNWFYCPGFATSTDPSVQPVLACVDESTLT